MLSSQMPHLEIYLALMEEIKLRIDCINRAMSQDLQIPPKLVQELCFLQLRMIFELIAISCLLTYGRHANIKTLERQWNANELVKRLAELNPKFFPTAVVIKEAADGALESYDVMPAPMTRQEFLKAYARCGNDLHRGSLKRIIDNMPPPPISFTDIRTVLRSIVDLLNTHRIPSPDFKTHYVCNMMSGPNHKACIITVGSL
jgi:hypothetical protein